MLVLCCVWRQKQIDPFAHACSRPAGREGPSARGMLKKGLSCPAAEKEALLGPRCHGKGCGRGESVTAQGTLRPSPLYCVYRPPPLPGWQDCACIFPLPWPLRAKIIIKVAAVCLVYSVFWMHGVEYPCLGYGRGWKPRAEFVASARSPEQWRVGPRVAGLEPLTGVCKSSKRGRKPPSRMREREGPRQGDRRGTRRQSLARAAIRKPACLRVLVCVCAAFASAFRASQRYIGGLISGGS